MTELKQSDRNHFKDMEKNKTMNIITMVKNIYIYTK